MSRDHKRHPDDVSLFGASDLSAGDLKAELEKLEAELKVRITLSHFPSFGIFQAEATMLGQLCPVALACSSDKGEIVPTLRQKLKEAHHDPT